MNRRSFLQTSVGVATLASTSRIFARSDDATLVISTWNHGLPANIAARATLRNGGTVLDAVEHGVMIVEADPTNLSVGLGGLPDRDGIVTLDASIMTGDCRAGSVCFVQGIAHPISLARMVMERTPHVILAGLGAERFAREQGISQVPNALTLQARKAWEVWCKEKNYSPVINIENHDTIGLLAINSSGEMAGACTTSGLAFKAHGRVGDSPIIGAGLYVDNEVGAATCTGLGESVLRTLASFLAVESMRSGASPQQACETAIKRIVSKHSNYKDFQVGILAIDRQRRHGAYSIQKGFSYALNEELKTSTSYIG